MTDDTSAPDGGGEAAPVIAPANLDSTDTYSPEQALEAYQKRTNPAAESADIATADTKSADEADAAPLEEATSEDTEEDAPAEKPSRDLPRSWTKDRAEIWNRLDPEAQDILLEQDRTASEAVRRSQNEAAAERNAAKAEREQAEQARKQYEAAKLDAVANLERDRQRDFPDIRTMDDVRLLQKNDPFRFQEWQIHQMSLTAAIAEKQAIEGRQKQEKQTEWTDFVTKQNALATEYIPELADSKKSQELTTKAGELLREIGFSQEDLNGFTSGEKVSLFDHRIQRLLFSAIKLNDVKAAPPKAIPKPVPAVQRPGVAPPKGNAASDVQALRNKLAGSGSVDDAFALYQAKQRRRS